MNPSNPGVDAVHSGGILLLRRTFAAVSIALGALLLAFAAGAALNPPTSDTVMFTITATNTGTTPINNVRVHDAAVDELGGTLSCPRASLGSGESVSCTASVGGEADKPHAARVSSGVLVGAASMTGGVLVLRFPRKPRESPGESTGGATI